MSGLGKICFALGIAMSPIAAASSVTLFFEDFEGYAFPPVGSNGVPAFDPGVPSLAEGAKGIWYGAHFAPPNVSGSQSANDMGVQQPVDYRPLDTIQGGRLSNEAGILFSVDTSAFVSASLSFDWTTWYPEPLDAFRFGYRVGSLPFGPCTGMGESGCYADFSGVADFWSSQFAELGSGQSPPSAPPGGSGKNETFALPVAPDVWVAFWMDSSVETASCPSYRCGIAMLDNVRVTGSTPDPQPTAVPLPGSVWLFAPGIALLLARVRRRRDA